MPKSGSRDQSIEEFVNIYLRENPEFSLALDQDIVNISQLSKKIVASKSDLKEISVRAALNRIRERTPGAGSKNKADELLRQSKISLQDKISVVKSDRGLPIKYISATFLEKDVVYIVDEMNQKLPTPGNGITIDSHVSMIHIYSPKEIEITPGFIMRITHKLYARGINILQLISCSNETILILKKDVCVAAYGILSTT